MNGTMMQYFHWFYSSEGELWRQLEQEAPGLREAGITGLWLPPAYKGNQGPTGMGYATYDLFDLGEFDQKGTVRTRWGNKDEFLRAVAAAKAQGIDVYEDVVFNHKQGADETEDVTAVAVNPQNRNDPPPGQGQEQGIKAWTHFTFPGRGDRYSAMKWHWYHFDAVDYDDNTKSAGTIWRLKEKSFDNPVGRDLGNYDYLMACDTDMENEEVIAELTRWGEWFTEQTDIDGFRIDAAKHTRFTFFNGWLDHLRGITRKPLFTVGEYHDYELGNLQRYINETGGRISLFDFPLQNKFHLASRHGGGFPMSQILDGTLTQANPTLSVPFVENHDTQPGRGSFAHPVEPWFKPLAYALILLRQEGYPCIFHPDYYGAEYTGQDNNHVTLFSHKFLLDRFLDARINHAYGPQYDWFDHDNVIGWTRLGDNEHPKAMAVVMSDGPEGNKWMNVARPNALFHDITGHIGDAVRCNADGWGDFGCRGGSVSVWVQE
uniref:Alpha-amylase n=1 Tax=Candidatus Kentrum sp. MB TaxID=2138164 RepID=A0A450XW97_9GAMM|nr:MAG: alpha-amylase [Candidatus Kentron sp. MB]VFK76695.1 MAG: alpha-amylase [Candidatus Kentron sp. MB]